ncbi:MAG: restriction endonuclease [Patescibacteria group bacterium]
MIEKYIKNYLSTLAVAIIITLVFGSWVIFDYVSIGWVLVFAGFFSVVAVIAFNTFYEENKFVEKQKLDELEGQISRLDLKSRTFEHSAGVYKQSLLEKSSGFPTLNSVISGYEEIRDNYLVNSLVTKRNPAYRAAEVVKEEGRRRRTAEAENRQTQAIIEYYESIAPFLLDFKDEIIEDEDIALQEFTDKEKADPVSNFLTKEEYRKLSSAERNQMALDRYWKRPKSKWAIGRMYERYIGYLYEKEGYSVNYHGIFQGLDDLGRDLICHKGKECLIVQCKNWSHFKTIHEKHIFQLFGTFFQYRDANPDKKPKAVFYTSTSLSDLARRFANELDIDLVENCKMDIGYPCIKCNIGKNKEKIYHLPFDQQYDTTTIEVNKGELYCSTIAQAEKAGFRRAYRWHGTK